MKKVSNHFFPIASETTTIPVNHNDIDTRGYLKPGRMDEWINIAAGICVQPYTGGFCSSCGKSNAQENISATAGDVIIIHARVTNTFITCLEVNVKCALVSQVTAQACFVYGAKFIFLAIDEKGSATLQLPLNAPVKPGKFQLHTAAAGGEISSRKEKHALSLKL